MADNGTLFLDEIGELSLALQAKLLRVLQYGDIQRVGDDRSLRVDVRVLAATNRDLREEVLAGNFRADLFHRLSVFPLSVPPLRERGEDVVLLAGYFCEQCRLRLGLSRVVLSPGARSHLLSYARPGMCASWNMPFTARWFWQGRPWQGMKWCWRRSILPCRMKRQ